MRILYLAFADLAVPKAWSTHIRSTCRHLSALGHDVLLVTPTPSAPAGEVAAPHLQLPIPWRRRRALLAFQAAAWSGLPQWTRRHRSDVVYARLVPFAFWLPGRVHDAGKPLVVEVNGVVEDELRMAGASWLRISAYRATERLIIEAADGVVAVSEPIARWVRASNPRVRRVAAIENGVDVHCFPDLDPGTARERLGLGEGRWVGFVGALFHTRNHVVLVQAIERVRRTVPSARLLVVGDGPARREMEEAARALGPEGIRFLGEVPHSVVPTAIAAMEVAVFLSSLPRAQSPIKLFEYMAARRPVVAGGPNRLGEKIERDGVGLGADPDSVESVAKAILRLLEHEDLAREMGHQGRALAESRYSWRQSAAGVAEFLRSVVANTGALRLRTDDR